MEKELYHNRETFLALLGESADIKKKTMYLGLKKDVGCFLAYVEITGGNFLFENSVDWKNIKPVLQYVKMMRSVKVLEKNALGISV